MGKLIHLNDYKSENIGRDFEIKGWTKVKSSPEVKMHYRRFLELSEQFFSRPAEENEKLTNSHGFAIPGYITYPGGRDGYFHDTTKMFHSTLFDEDQAGTDGVKSFMKYGSIWPDLPEYVESFKVLRDYLHDVSNNTLSAVEQYYSMPKGDLTEMIKDGWSVQRSMQYPAYEDESRIGGLTVGEHRDTSLLTVTFGGSQPGLEVKNEHGDWEPVKGEECDVIAGVGGMLEHIVNGNFKNMFHRVKCVKETIKNPRISSPFFCWPRPECVLKPHPKVLEHYNQIPRYQPQLSINHLEQNLMVAFSFEEDKERIASYRREYLKAS